MISIRRVVLTAIAWGWLDASAWAASAHPIGGFAVPVPVPRPADLDKPPPRVLQAPAPPPSPAATVPTGDSGTALEDCRADLRAIGAVAAPAAVGSQPDPRCIVVEPVRVVSVSGRDGNVIGVVDRPLLACATALALATYVRDLLDPLTKGTYGASLATISTGPGLECRPRDHIPGAKLSAHGEGLAVDIASLALADGRTFSVGHPSQDRDRSYERAARAGACGYFHTTLGPGADAFHETHWHFDLLPRGSKGDAKLCE